jgi:hypothetical protein
VSWRSLALPSPSSLGFRAQETSFQSLEGARDEAKNGALVAALVQPQVPGCRAQCDPTRGSSSPPKGATQRHLRLGTWVPPICSAYRVLQTVNPRSVFGLDLIAVDVSGSLLSGNTPLLGHDPSTGPAKDGPRPGRYGTLAHWHIISPALTASTSQGSSWKGAKLSASAYQAAARCFLLSVLHISVTEQVGLRLFGVAPVPSGPLYRSLPSPCVHSRLSDTFHT